MTTGASLTGSVSVRKLQTVLHAKAKEEPGRRFHALVDKVWRKDFLLAAWALVRRNGGAAGVDGVTVADVKAHGVERWVGELSRELRKGTYKPSPVRQVLIPKKQPGKFRPLGIPCLRDRVAQTSAMLVLMPIFEADLEPEQYGYRPGRSRPIGLAGLRLIRGRCAVADAPLGEDVGRGSGAVAEIGPEFLDDRAEAVGVAGVAAAPHLAEERFHGHDPPHAA